jgi:hypothetical protein
MDSVICYIRVYASQIDPVICYTWVYASQMNPLICYMSIRQPNGFSNLLYTSVCEPNGSSCYTWVCASQMNPPICYISIWQQNGFSNFLYTSICEPNWSTVVFSVYIDLLTAIIKTAIIKILWLVGVYTTAGNLAVKICSCVVYHPLMCTPNTGNDNQQPSLANFQHSSPWFQKSIYFSNERW